jgi:peptidoglycan/xylan/chitin deacetylase (PgdA/CDA1 family)
MLIVANYHYVRPSYDNPHPGIHGVTVDEFRAQLQRFAEVGIFVSAEDILAACDGTGTLPDRAFVITFDDGLREQAEHARPVLDDLQIPAIFFVNTRPIEEERVCTVHKLHLLRAFTPPGEVEEELARTSEELGIDIDLDAVPMDRAVDQYPYDERPHARLKYLLNFVLDREERTRLVDRVFERVWDPDEGEVSRELYMDPDQVRALDRDHHIGTHGHDHLPMGQLRPNATEAQVHRSMDLLHRWTGRDIVALSYPYGSRPACGGQAPRIAEKAGIRFAFTMERAGNANLDEPLMLARCANNDLPGGSSPGWPLGDLFESIPHRTRTVGDGACNHD